MPEFGRFVGIDVAKDRLDVHIHPDGIVFAVPNTRPGAGQLIERVGPTPATAFALEASGGYERTVAESLAGAGRVLFCLHPADVRAFARLNGKRAKTDRLDAALIARAAAAAAATRKPYRTNKTANDLKEMIAGRQLVIDHLTTLKGQLSRATVEPLRTLVAKRIKAAKADIKRLDVLIAETVTKTEALRDKARRIQTAPGAGPVLTATLLADMSELGTLSSRQAASLVGVAPHPRQSGTSQPPGRCHGGRARLRRVLYMATLAAIRCKKTPLHAFYERLRANGKPFKLAIVAAMRKFIITLNAMLKENRDWTPNHAT
ncbi:MAG: IS110 family transposase [Rhodospirillales bacterium]